MSGSDTGEVALAGDAEALSHDASRIWQLASQLAQKMSKQDDNKAVIGRWSMASGRGFT